MATQEFAHSFQVSRPPAECWMVLTDVTRVSSWVSVVGAVTEHERLSSYSAVLEDRMGPFRLRADLDVGVSEIVDESSITIRADGEDRQVGSRITVDATLALRPTDPGCSIDIAGRYEVTGRVATMGAATIRKKADIIVDEFVAAAKHELA